MAAQPNIFWCKVFFQAFIKHYRKMNDEQIVNDIRQSMDDLEDLVPDTDSFGSQMVRWALERADEPFATAARENGKKGGRPKKKQETTADGDIREDSQDRKSGTSANLYGEATHREAWDESTTFSDISQDAPNGNAGDERRSGSNSVATVNLVHPAPNMRRVPQNEAPAHGFSGGRTAQGTMSRSPEAAAQSGKDYDQETDPVSTDEARQSQARESQRRAGADSVRGTPLHSAPARPRAKNSRCPNSREDFHAFVADNNLHEGLAEEWYAMHEAREWVDKNGNPIKDWRGALYNYCTKTEQKRRTA